MNTYKVEYTMRPMRGHTVLRIPYTDKVALSAAWGLIATKRLFETYTLTQTHVYFRLRNRTFREWLDILKAVDCGAVEYAQSYLEGDLAE